MRTIKSLLWAVLFTLLLFSCGNVLNTDGSGSTDSKSDGNDKITSATNYTIGNGMPFKISNGDDVDYFKFSVSKSGVYFISVSNIPSTFNLCLATYDKEYTSIFTRYPQSSDEATISFGDQFAAGDYYLQINGGWGEFSNQEMMLKIYMDLSDTMELNGTFSTSYPIELNTYYRATIFPADETDYYKFTLDSNQIVRIKLDSVSSRLNMGIRLSDDEDVLVESITSVKNTAPLDWGIILKRGTYTLKLDAGWLEYSVNPYRLIVECDTTDPTEWNGDTSNAVKLEFGQQIQAAIYPIADYDFFKFTLDTADTILIMVDSISSALSNFRVYVFDAEMVQKTYTSSLTGASTSVCVFLNAGFYYLKVQSESRYSFKKYTLKVDKASNK
ncbi:MAG TPA: hypothetical protein VHO70_14570 [Chitinispirillaceae bacterium]|nr:hypothetical protein [Chitinispirillaceae bacterium]